MSAHRHEMSDLRVGANVTLRDWQGNLCKGAAYMAPSGAWLMRTRSGAVHPVLPRELIAIEHGAREYFAKLYDGAQVTFADWEGGKVTGIAHRMAVGWEAREASGARWLLEPHRIISIQED